MNFLLYLKQNKKNNNANNLNTMEEKMKTLMTAAFLTVLFIGASADAMMMGNREGIQNYYYYFGAPCKTMCQPECDPCAASGNVVGDVVGGVFGGPGRMVNGML